MDLVSLGSKFPVNLLQLHFLRLESNSLAFAKFHLVMQWEKSF
jgi:hypothetical protein